MFQMYLIDLKNVQLKKSSPQRKDRYAILSHRWTKREVEYQNISSSNFRWRSTSRKFRGAIEKARQDKFKFLWIDSCCINQQSSSELSEAINSMYQWYQAADICYAYLGDVDLTRFDDSFSKSKWFRRGWTLQELLASQKIEFYDCEWQFLGDKITLAASISDATGIPAAALHSKSLNSYSIAQKMAWAAKRVTSRPEDIAYCLMGLFDVNMPLLYGEGAYKAFIRLQEEILKYSDDHSIFSWSMGKAKAAGLLAPRPIYFADANRRVSGRFTNRGTHDIA